MAAVLWIAAVAVTVLSLSMAVMVLLTFRVLMGKVDKAEDRVADLSRRVAELADLAQQQPPLLMQQQLPEQRWEQQEPLEPQLEKFYALAKPVQITADAGAGTSPYQSEASHGQLDAEGHTEHVPVPAQAAKDFENVDIANGTSANSAGSVPEGWIGPVTQLRQSMQPVPPSCASTAMPEVEIQEPERQISDLEVIQRLNQDIAPGSGKVDSMDVEYQLADYNSTAADSMHRDVSNGSAVTVGSGSQKSSRIPSKQSSERGRQQQSEVAKRRRQSLSQQAAELESTGKKLSSMIDRKITKRGKLAEKIWQFLDQPESSRNAYVFSKILDPLVIVTVFLNVTQTLEEPMISEPLYTVITLVVDAFFLLEVTIRFSACPSYGAFMRSFYNLTDFTAAVVPLSIRLVALAAHFDVSSGPLHYILHCFAPVLRILKVLRHFQQFHLFIQVVTSIHEALQVLLVLLALLVLCFASLLYIAEPRSNLNSMPQAMWLTIVTMTTVGYGDKTPESVPGYLIASSLAVCSVLYMAMPIGIIGNAFTQIWQDRDRILLMIKTRDRLLQSGYEAKDLPNLFREYNTEGTGELNIMEFYKMVMDMRVGLSEERVVEVFNSLDRDGGGTIDEQEFIRAVFPSAFHQIYNDKAKEEETSEEDGGGLGSVITGKVGQIARQISPWNDG
mmetsp:Transcript_23579/g.42599  ORF Transcript_23579/g.42599 Transcript_23579/m.42599 type:complete len:673 (+) Transcript_23579:58-2076(+)